MPILSDGTIGVDASTGSIVMRDVNGDIIGFSGVALGKTLCQ